MHRVLIVVGILVVAFLAFLVPSTPIQALGAFTLMAAGALIGLFVLVAVTLFVAQLLFDRPRRSRYVRFN